MRKLKSALVFVALLFVWCCPKALANENAPQKQVLVIEQLNEKVTVVKIRSVGTSNAKNNTGSSITQRYYYDGIYVGQATLTATFSYDGITARATSVASGHWTSPGWKYGNETLYTNGGSAYLNAQFSGETVIPVSITITCDPYGNIY